MLALALESPPMRLQRAFAEAILSGDAPVPATVREASGPAHASRFSVYRNNVIAGLINAVSARYPVVRKLLWDDAFNRVAHQYVVSEPPRSPVLLQYGESFPKFLRGIGQGAAANYLADVAEIEVGTNPRLSRRRRSAIIAGRHSTPCQPTNGRSSTSRCIRPSLC